MSRQSESIARIRAARRAKKKCAQCGAPAKKFRCPKCTGEMKLYMRRRRLGGKC